MADKNKTTRSTTKTTKKTSSRKPTQLQRDKEEWLKLCAWIELNIFEYDSKQKLQKKACGVLDGLRKGQNVANINIPMNGEYPMEVILMTFQIYKDSILNSTRKKEFNSEEDHMKYVCAIVRNHINDVYTRYLNAQKMQEKAEIFDVNVIEHQGAEYQSTVKENKKEDKFKELW